MSFIAAATASTSAVAGAANLFAALAQPLPSFQTMLAARIIQFEAESQAGSKLAWKNGDEVERGIQTHLPRIMPTGVYSDLQQQPIKTDYVHCTMTIGGTDPLKEHEVEIGLNVAFLADNGGSGGIGDRRFPQWDKACVLNENENLFWAVPVGVSKYSKVPFNKKWPENNVRYARDTLSLRLAPGTTGFVFKFKFNTPVGLSSGRVPVFRLEARLRQVGCSTPLHTAVCGNVLMLTNRVSASSGVPQEEARRVFNALQDIFADVISSDEEDDDFMDESN